MFSVVMGLVLFLIIFWVASTLILLLWEMASMELWRIKKAWFKEGHAIKTKPP
uniref:Uncharacterized protein n=1 Tax=viral metagenome TaxID=1070528 RepID=A0A6M3KH98_9ZZZZ